MEKTRNFALPRLAGFRYRKKRDLINQISESKEGDVVFLKDSEHMIEGESKVNSRLQLK